MGDHGRRNETARVYAAAPDPGDAAAMPAGPGPLAGDPFLGDFSDYDVVVGDWRPNPNLYGRAPAAIFGLGGDDHIDGSRLGDWLEGGAGNDFIDAGNGGDIIWGGEGADFVKTGNGADRLIFVAGDVGGPDTNVPTSRSPDVIEDFDPVHDRLEFYGFSGPPTIEQVGEGAYAYVLLTFANGDYIKLNYMTAARIAANRDCIRMMEGPGPSARQEEDGRPVEMSADITLAEGEVRTFDQGLGYDTRTFTLTNHGTILVEMQPGVGAGDSLAATGVHGHLVNGETGIIRAVNHGNLPAIGLSSAFDGASNAGLIEAIASEATGVYARSSYWSFSNSGTVRAVGDELAMGVYLSNSPMVFSAPQRARVQVANSGQILAEGETAIGIRTDMNMTLTNSGLVQATGELVAIGYISDFNGSFTNTGTIRATTAPGGAASIGIHAYNLEEPIAYGGGFQTYANHGLIEADIAILIEDSDGFFMQSSVERVLNTGTIRGHTAEADSVGVSYAIRWRGWFVNTGLVEADYALRMTPGHTALSQGYVINTGELRGRIALGSDAVTLFNDSLNCDTGRDALFFGGTGDDRLTGGGGDDRLYGGAGDDIMTGRGRADLLDGGDGYDVYETMQARELYWLLVDGDGFVLKGEEGSDRLIDVELIRFHDGTVIDLAKQYGPDGWGAWVRGGEGGPQVLPSSPDGASGPEAKVLDDAWVLPSPDADAPPVMPPPTGDFAGFKHPALADRPEIMPGVDDPLPLLLRAEGARFKHMGSLPWLAPGLTPSPAALQI